MNWKQIYDHMDERERLEMLRLLLKRVEHPRRVLRPAHLLFPAMLAQMILLSISFWMKSFSQAAIGNLIIASLAMLPSVFPQKRRFQAHWVRSL